MNLANFGALVLAAGKGTRMFGLEPKVLQKLLDEPMLGYVLMALENAGFSENIWMIAGYGHELVTTAFPDYKWILQAEQLGTGHALACALKNAEVAEKEYLLIVNGDTPLITAHTLKDFIRQSVNCDFSFLTITPKDSAQYGRVIRKNGTPMAIIEAKDFEADLYPDFHGEVNVGIYLLRLKTMFPLVDRLKNDNKSGEYYLTDLISLAFRENLKILGICCGDDENLLGINTPFELTESEEILRARIVLEQRKSGVLIHSPQSVRCGPYVQISPGVEITGPVELYGKTHLEEKVKIFSHCIIKDCLIQKNSVIQPFCHLENAILCEETVVGPYARLRPGTIAQARSHIGNFVELKKTVLGEGSKANHLSYLGDSQIGPNVNIGAGTITCNYDGKNKFPTIIDENAFIGSNTSLVAPVKIGKNSLVGAGSVITKDVPEGDLAVGRSRQVNMKRR